MYYQKPFDIVNPNHESEDEITEIHKEHKDYGYRKVCGELRNKKIFVNKKKIQKNMCDLNNVIYL